MPTSRISTTQTGCASHIGTIRDLERQEIRLTDGLLVTLYTDDADDHGQPDEMRAEGVVHYDEGQKCWVAEIDWNGLWHASDEPIAVAGRKSD